MNKKILIYFFLFILGFLFRFWLIHLVPQPVLIGDQYDYNRYAIGILHNGLFALSSRLYGYPLFLALIYGFFGEGNTNAVIFIQILLDTATAFLVFWLTLKMFKKEGLAFIALLISLFNPFTSNFSGLILTEILAIFLTTAIFGLFLLFLEGRSKVILITLTILLGFLPQVRPPFLFFTLFLLLFLVFFTWSKNTQTILSKLKESILILVLYSLPFLYTIAGNKAYFNELAPLTVDNIFVRELYISMFIGRSPSHDVKLILDPPMYMFPSEVKNVYIEIAKTQNRSERKDFAQKYFNLSIDQIVKHPKSFIISRAMKMWYVWEKHYIFYYFEPFSALAIFIIYWGNVWLISLALLGLYFSIGYWANREKGNDFIWFSWVSVFLFFYISVLHVFSLSEERYSLPAYPLIFIFASFMLFGVIKLISKKVFLMVPKSYSQYRKK